MIVKVLDMSDQQIFDDIRTHEKELMLCRRNIEDQKVKVADIEATLKKLYAERDWQIEEEKAKRMI